MQVPPNKPMEPTRLTSVAATRVGRRQRAAHRQRYAARRPSTKATRRDGRFRKGLLAICALRETLEDGAVHPRRWLTKLEAGNRGIKGTRYGESVPFWIGCCERFRCTWELETELRLGALELVSAQGVESCMDLCGY